MINLIAVGADPEVFLTTKNGHPVSAEGLLGGTKAKPKQMDGLPPGFMIQEDNVAAEFNIPPAMDANTFSRNILQGLLYVKKQATKHGLKVAVVPALHFDKEALSTPHAMTLGCDLDLDFWRLAYNPTPAVPATLRTAAGHIHVSWTNPKDEQRVCLARALDLYLGVPSILVTEKSERRSLYGKAGCVRVKPYGLEYRTLDNFWIAKADYRKKVFYNVSEAVATISREGDFFNEEVDNHQEEIQEAINNHNKDVAQMLIKEFNVLTF